MVGRKLLWLGPQGQASSGPLRERGWQPLVANDAATAKRLLLQPPQLGVVCVAAREALSVGWLEDCLRMSSGMEWVGVFAPEVAGLPIVREWVMNYLFDFHVQPVDWQQLDFTLEHALRRARLRDQDDINHPTKADLGLVGHSPAIVRLRQEIRKVSATAVPVLIAGESGSGKELAARAIHETSARADGPFVAVNCGAI
ncbi:MAG: hypothetical protein JWQ72_328, partial [Polaromonas sp.]|nr:hypothetical protein [Polaromonas sp.]